MANLSAKNTPGRLKDTYALYKRNRSAILSGAPGQIKAPLTLIFSFDDKFFAALAKANWNAAAINPSDLQAIVSQTQKILPATRTVIKYFNKHCGTHIAVP
jgi:hypothetical protein